MLHGLITVWAQEHAGQAAPREAAPSIVSVRGFGYKLAPGSPATSAA